MAKRGRKPLPRKLKVVGGTDQPCRRNESPVDDSPAADSSGAPTRPKHLVGEARKAWERKVDRYRKRGFPAIEGCEDALAAFCLLEARIITDARRKIETPMAVFNAHRIYANEFFETPASRFQGGTGGPKKGNKYRNSGPPPAKKK